MLNVVENEGKKKVGDSGPSSFLYGPNLYLLGYKEIATMLS